MDDATADAIADGEQWAARQAALFPAFLQRYASAPERYDFSVASLDEVAYQVLQRFSSAEDIEELANTDFADGASWYLGEVARRIKPKWEWMAERGLYKGRYGVRKPTKHVADGMVPSNQLASLADSGDPFKLKRLFTRFVVDEPEPWRAYIAGTDETGTWAWDGAQWVSQRDQWSKMVPPSIDVLRSQLPSVDLDHSEQSLAAVERFVLEHAPDDAVRTAVVAYLGETLVRRGNGRWIWQDDYFDAAKGFPMVRRRYLGGGDHSPAHVLQYALTWRDGVTFARLLRGWVRTANANDTGPAQPAPSGVEEWLAAQRRRFDEWAAVYGAEHTWDFSPESLDSLGAVILAHTPSGTRFLHGPEGQRFHDGAAWYFGETVLRTKPSYWRHYVTEACEDSRLSALGIWTNLARDDSGLAVHPVQEFNEMLLGPGWVHPWQPDPTMLRRTLEQWRSSHDRKRVKDALKRREQARRKSGRRLSDDEYLARWLSERESAWPTWVQRFGADLDWDFGPDTLAVLEQTIRSFADGPEELLENPQHAEFLDGVAWYLGEVLRRADPAQCRWRFNRNYQPEPYAVMDRYSLEVFEEPAKIYADVPPRPGNFDRLFAYWQKQLTEPRDSLG
jgi:hypothetical protein